LGAAALLVLSLPGCGRREETSETAEEEAAPGPNPAAKPVDLSTVGSVSGSVRFEGTPPRMRTINMNSVPACARMYETPPTMGDVLIGEGGALQNAVVYLKGDFSAYTFPAATEPVTIDQKGCMYVPRVVALTTSTPLRIHNSDSATHNTFPRTEHNREWNETQAVGGAPVEHIFTRPEVAITLRCNIHPWMVAEVAVFDHPYFQVTGPDGSFSLKNVPPGTYGLTVWHERLGTREQTVTIGPKGEENVSITFTAGSRE
jgi:hypothetical protein